MTIYVFAGDRSTEEGALRHRQARTTALEKGFAVFGWGYHADYDLNNLKDNEHYGKIRFLKNIKAGDKIVYTHYSHKNDVEKGNHYGQCLVMTVVGEQPYSFNNEILEKHGDFANTISIDINTIYEFNRNDPAIHRRIAKALCPRSSYQKIKEEYVDKFNSSIENHKKGITNPDYFNKEIGVGVDAIIKAIQHNHPAAELEYFAKNLLTQVYTSMYDNVNIYRVSSAWKPQDGADLILTYTTKEEDIDVPIPTQDMKVVVQVKSYEWSINSDHPIDQCKEAIAKFNADYAIIFTTATMGATFQEKLDAVNSPTNNGEEKIKPIICLSALDVVKLYLKYNI